MKKSKHLYYYYYYYYYSKHYLRTWIIELLRRISQKKKDK